MKRQRGYIDAEVLVPLLICIVVLAILWALFSALNRSMEREQAKWNAFASSHACKVVGRTQGHMNIGNTVTPTGKGGSSVGVIVTSTPGQVGWQCNDGITYWRNE